jgi:2-polyprenyl-3-methyl-5-hydroxy-6-metoxy-1,4-benzoquinol methylase
MISCVACDSQNVKKLLSWKEYSICKCVDCGLILTLPLPDDDFLKNYYQGFLYNMPDKSEVQRQILSRKKELSQLFSFNKSNNHQSFLDYGGGTGATYRAAQQLGLKAFYHDLDDKAKEFVKNEHGLSDNETIYDITRTEQRFDSIFSDNVIEHVKDPVLFVAQLRNVLNPGGKLIIKTPHARNTEALFYPFISIKGYFLNSLKYNSLKVAVKSYFARFWHCDPPRHLYSFSKSSLESIALKAGFKKKEIVITYYRIPLFEYSITRLIFSPPFKFRFKTIVLKAIALPFVPLELLFKMVQLILSSSGLLSPGGIILKIQKKS